MYFVTADFFGFFVSTFEHFCATYMLWVRIYEMAHELFGCRPKCENKSTLRS